MQKKLLQYQNTLNQNARYKVYNYNFSLLIKEEIQDSILRKRWKPARHGASLVKLWATPIA